MENVKYLDKHTLNSLEIELTSDLAAEFPIYLYVNDDKNYICYSNSIEDLLNSSYIKKPLSVSSEGLSFLLQSGVVPPPKTIYKNIFVVGIGDKVLIKNNNEVIELIFSHKFPFMSVDRLHQDEMIPDNDLILELLLQATVSRIDSSKPTFFFHSAGKDSNSILLALAEGGYQQKITCVCQKTLDSQDESSISKIVAEKLGFKHVILEQPTIISKEFFASIIDHFTNTPLPWTDGVTLAFPAYPLQLPALRESNLVDGSGNDVYIGNIPPRSEYRKQRLTSLTQKFHWFADHMNSASVFSSIRKTRAEWCGLGGFLFSDTKKIYPPAISVLPYWTMQSKERRLWDYIDFRSDIRGTIVDVHIFNQKVRNVSYVWKSNPIYPWCDKEVAKYFSKLPEKYVFDRHKLKNKLILRSILKERIGLDSDKIGKRGYGYDNLKILQLLIDNAKYEITTCNFWDKTTVTKKFDALYTKAYSTDKYYALGRNLLLRLYLLSLWLNHNRYIN